MRITCVPWLGLLVLGAAIVGCAAPAGDVMGPGEGVGPGPGSGGISGSGPVVGSGGNEAILATGGATGSGAFGDGVLRDFRDDFPDFIPCDEPGTTGKTCNSRQSDYFQIAAMYLTNDGKPAYAGPPEGTLTTFGSALPACGGVPCFDHWFRTDEFNLEFPYQLDFVPTGTGVYTYDNQAFFPLDGQGFGNDHAVNPEHNYGFTFELHAAFTYVPGLIFTFIGDDDVFVYVDSVKQLDLGGIHEAAEATIEFDTLGLAEGPHTLDFFFAERKPPESHFRIDLSPELIQQIR
jgi:fibro-slime domain-containing protein